MCNKVSLLDRLGVVYSVLSDSGKFSWSEIGDQNHTVATFEYFLPILIFSEFRPSSLLNYAQLDHKLIEFYREMMVWTGRMVKLENLENPVTL